MPTPQHACLYCQRTDDEVPLIQFEYRGEQHWICPQHFPILIHKPSQLAPYLPGLENLEGSDHEH